MLAAARAYRPLPAELLQLRMQSAQPPDLLLHRLRFLHSLPNPQLAALIHVVSEPTFILINDEKTSIR